MINTLFTGLGFKDPFLISGYKLPKNLQVNNGDINILKAIECYSSDIQNTQVILGKSECDLFKTDEIIAKRHPEVSIVKLDRPTRGSLVTAILGLNNLDLSQPLVIAPTDSFYSTNISKEIQNLIHLDVNCGVLIVKDQDPRWSYVTLNKLMEVTAIREKNIISDFATIGIFYFKSAEIFLQSATWCLVNSVSMNDEYYISHSLNYLIASGKKIKATLLMRENYFPLKSPIDFVSKK
jgi:dTDP-glucose pyrophosphorylase